MGTLGACRLHRLSIGRAIGRADRVPWFLLREMREHAADEQVVAAACGSVWSLAMHNSCRAELVEYHVVSSLMEVGLPLPPASSQFYPISERCPSSEGTQAMVSGRWQPGGGGCPGPLFIPFTVHSFFHMAWHNSSIHSASHTHSVGSFLANLHCGLCSSNDLLEN